MPKKIPMSEFPVHFWSRVDQTAGADKCWPWQGATREAGYGSIKRNGRMTTAHRVAFELSKGAIREGLIIRHTCDNPVCCNPQHLLSGTHVDNARDAMGRKRWVPPPTFIGDNHPRSRLTAARVSKARSLHNAGKTIAALAREYEVGETTMRHAIKYDTWKHVND